MSNVTRFFMGLGIAIIVVGFVAMLFLPGLLGYIAHTVNSDQIGVVEQYGQVQEIVGPGTYSDLFRWRADIHNIRISATQFNVEDAEVLTKGGEQAVGVVVAGDVFRPNLTTMTFEDALRIWSFYRPLMQDDNAIQQRVGVMAQQAMKECVGDRSFEQAAVGSGRDDLRQCIDASLEGIGSEIGLTFQNVSVPNIILTEAQRQRIDDITNARTAIQLADTQAQQASAEGRRNAAQRQAEAQAEIAPTQAYLEARATQAVLELSAVNAENSAQIARLNAQKEQKVIERDIVSINAEIAIMNARVHNADTEQLASIMQNYPEYAAIVRTENISNAIASIEIMYLPDGTNPLTAMGYTQLANGVFGVTPFEASPTPIP